MKKADLKSRFDDLFHQVEREIEWGVGTEVEKVELGDMLWQARGAMEKGNVELYERLDNEVRHYLRELILHETAVELRNGRARC